MGLFPLSSLVTSENTASTIMEDSMAETSPAPALAATPEVLLTKSHRPKPSSQLAPPLIGAILAAGTALLLHWRRDMKRQAATNAALSELRIERDIAQKQLEKLEVRLSKHLEDYAKINDSNREILDAYDTILKGSEELSSRLERTEVFNKELQQKIKKERAERARCEKKIVQLQKKIEEQEAELKLHKSDDHGSPHSARSDDSAKVLEENNKRAHNVPGMGQQKWVKQLQ